MIISYANNFVVLRLPKTGSTSLAFYFFKSGLLDFKKDLYTLEGNFSGWKNFEAYYKEHGLDYSSLPPELHGAAIRLKLVNRSFDDLRAKGAIQPDMPCVASIRNPLEWVASLFYYTRLRRNLNASDPKAVISLGDAHIPHSVGFKDKNYGNPNDYWDYVKENWTTAVVVAHLKPQSDYFPEHAELFNVENIHEHASKFILDRGGRVEERIEMRKNSVDKLTSFLTELSPDRKQDILDTYAKDLVLWEKAYAVYN
jgi:hypothetical protein|tara:strand:- start:157 stop:921 length:765 start_codon:yes stop_codon:yes gene_type:complete